EAMAVVRPGDLVVLTLGQEPLLLSAMLQARAGEVEDVTILCAGPGGGTGWFDPGVSDSFRVQVQNSYRYTFRDFVSRNQAEFVPNLFTLMFKGLEEDRLGARRPDVFMTIVSLPDEDGFCSFGHSLWNKRAYVKWSRKVIAEVDERQMRTCGDNRVHVSEIDLFVENTLPEPEEFFTLPEPDDVVRQIGEHVGSLVNHGDTIQIGWSRVAMQFPAIGVFDNKLDLGLHTEVTAPRLPNLVEEGVINGKRKTLNPGVAVVTALAGAGRDMLLAVDNPRIELRDVEYTNDLRVISAHDNMVAINGAVSVDMTGQINVETGPGLYPINGHGGQPEFFFGSLMSKGGRAITTLRSTDRGGTESRIVAALEEGAAVTIPRSLADYVVTEYGIARLLGKSLKERAEELVGLAHPQFRGELRRALKKRFYSHA
ncbi:MAG: acetyl-CoA hydrolase/transferase C-terminal domain-containing protein, partial [Dehalococcoidia bacterium]